MDLLPVVIAVLGGLVGLLIVTSSEDLLHAACAVVAVIALPFDIATERFRRPRGWPVGGSPPVIRDSGRGRVQVGPDPVVRNAPRVTPTPSGGTRRLN